jgi:aminoglycoside phosphotransferase family enzyme
MDVQTEQALHASSLAAKVRFLSDPGAYSVPLDEVDRVETHMSWVFCAGDRVYKLKKPVRFPYLDFSTVERREAACRAEVRLNRRLARDVYLGVKPLTSTHAGLAIDGRGNVVDWLVVMHRLEVGLMLDRAVADGRVRRSDVERVVRTLIAFYRRARPIPVRPEAHLAAWRRSISLNHAVLMQSRFGLPLGEIQRVTRAQREFLRHPADLFARVRAGAIVDGHGDLRPEHIWLGDPIRIIDCLEFNPVLRTVDPLDEVAYLGIECERIGAAWIGDLIRHDVVAALHDGVSDALFAFYACHRATLRARLAIAHLLDMYPRTPEKWPRVARTYLVIAARHAVRLERLIKTRGGR